MNINDLKDMAYKLKERPISGRKLVIFIGKIEKIREVIPKEILKEIDILNFNIRSTELDDMDICKQISKKLNSELNVLLNKLENQQILLIKNSFLFARYKISLAPFYKYYLSDRTMVIIHLPVTIFKKELPKYILFNSNNTLKFFEDILPEEHKQNIIKED